MLIIHRFEVCSQPMACESIDHWKLEYFDTNIGILFLLPKIVCLILLFFVPLNRNLELEWFFNLILEYEITFFWTLLKTNRQSFCIFYLNDEVAEIFDGPPILGHEHNCCFCTGKSSAAKSGRRLEWRRRQRNGSYRGVESH